eukprot:31129-Pelagococcus_subviridis.AAC.4
MAATLVPAAPLRVGVAVASSAARPRGVVADATRASTPASSSSSSSSSSSRTASGRRALLSRALLVASTSSALAARAPPSVAADVRAFVSLDALVSTARDASAELSLARDALATSAALGTDLPLRELKRRLSSGALADLPSAAERLDRFVDAPSLEEWESAVWSSVSEDTRGSREIDDVTGRRLRGVERTNDFLCFVFRRLLQRSARAREHGCVAVAAAAARRRRDGAAWGRAHHRGGVDAERGGRAGEARRVHRRRRRRALSADQVTAVREFR